MHDINAADMRRVYWGQSAQTRPSDSYYFEVSEKLTRACYIQIIYCTRNLAITYTNICYRYVLACTMYRGKHTCFDISEYKRISHDKNMDIILYYQIDGLILKAKKLKSQYC